MRDDSVGRVTCLRSAAAREQNEVAGGISPVSNFLLTSCPVADKWLCQGVHSVRSGDTLLSSALFHMKLQHQKAMVKQQLTIGEL